MKGSIVAIKERQSEKDLFVKAWKKEIKAMKMIEKKVPDLFTSRLISVLNDTPTSQIEKYIVMEWIEGRFTSNLFV